MVYDSVINEIKIMKMFLYRIFPQFPFFLHIFFMYHKLKDLYIYKCIFVYTVYICSVNYFLFYYIKFCSCYCFFSFLLIFCCNFDFIDAAVCLNSGDGSL